MNGVVVKMVGSKLVVEVDILRAIAEGVGGARPISTVKPAPSPRPPARRRRKRTPRRPGRVGTARASTFGYPRFLLGRLMAPPGALNAFRGHRREPNQLHRPPYEPGPGGAWS
jgi:hypothetical protein